LAVLHCNRDEHFDCHADRFTHAKADFHAHIFAD
jgi:hypothetical protein